MDRVEKKSVETRRECGGRERPGFRLLKVSEGAEESGGEAG